MAGIRIGGVATYPPLTHPPFPYVAFESGTQNTIWLMGAGMTPTRLSTTTGTVLTNPMLSPTNQDEALYASVTFSGDTIIYVVDLANNTKSAVVTLTGQTVDPMAYWHPNGRTIVYRQVSGGTADIRTIKSDGSNDQSLYTSSYGFGQDLTCVCFSPSGDYIAFGKGSGVGTNEVWIMQSDGSSPGSVATSVGDLQWSTPYCWMGWQNNSDVLGWAELDSSTTGNVEFRKVNADGSGLTTLASVANRASPSPQVLSVGVGRFPWLLDDSAMVTLWVDGTTAPIWRLATVDGAGGGISYLDTHFSYASKTANPYGQGSWNYTPQVFRGESAYADGRIYYTGGAASGGLINQDVLSVLADGTDLRTDDDGTGSPSHGWWTVTGTAD